MHKPRIINWAEKRIKGRHKAPDLRCTLSFKGTFGWLRPSVQIGCLDFNRYGMAAITKKPIREGATVSLSFRGKYIVKSNVLATISSCHETLSGYRVSIVFSYATDSKYYDRNVDNALSRIERIYSQQ